MSGDFWTVRFAAIESEKIRVCSEKMSASDGWSQRVRPPAGPMMNLAIPIDRRYQWVSQRAQPSYELSRLVRATCDICRSSFRSEPMSLVNVELHRAVVTHFQQQRLAIVLIFYVHALHDFESFQRLFLKGNQNLFSISHWGSWRWPP
jgi:hypothetical protein